MSEQLVKTIFNATTGETTVVPLTDEEIQQLEENKARSEAFRIEQEAEAARIAELKASAKAKLVAGEPLTEEEAATLVI